MSAGRAQRVCGAVILFYLVLPWQITVEPTPTVNDNVECGLQLAMMQQCPSVAADVGIILVQGVGD